jgi:hypothetical protein
MEMHTNMSIAGLLTLAVIGSAAAQAKGSADYELVGDYK